MRQHATYNEEEPMSRQDVILALLERGWVVARVKGDGSEPLSVTLRQS